MPLLTTTTRRRSHRARTTSCVVSGACYLAAAAAARGVPGAAERRLFTAVNGDRDQVLLRVPQQLGTPWVLPGVAVVAVLLADWRLAGAAALALPVVKGCEVSTKHVVGRPRPGRVLEDAVRHDDAPLEGPSYPSGHAAIAACALVLVAPHLPAAVLAPLGLGAAVTAATRVHQGAHFPLDVAGGALLGVAVATACATAADAVVDRVTG